MIELRRDAYGRDADASALADYLELLALKDIHPSRADLADFMKDSSWTTDPKKRHPLARPQERVLLAGEDAESADEGDLQDRFDAHSRRVFDLVLVRIEVLGARYPFVVLEERIYAPRPFRHETATYLALLGITVAHAYDLTTTTEPHDAFEDMVASVMAERGLRTHNLARRGRGAASFDVLLGAAGPLVQLDPTPSAASRSMDAQDGGVDIISHMWWGDRRTAAWVFLGQATVGKSETWDTKMQEVRPQLWQLYLNLLLPPIAYLAVPHHVEPKHFIELVQGNGRVLLDRLRLVMYRDEPTDSERDFVRVLDREEVMALP